MTSDEYVGALDELFERVMARMSLLSDGKSSLAADSRGSSPGKPGGTLILNLTPVFWAHTIQNFQRRYDGARRVESKREIIAESLRELVRARRAPKARGMKWSKEWREKVARDPRSPHVVAVLYDITRPTVYKYRAEFKMNGQKAA